MDCRANSTAKTEPRSGAGRALDPTEEFVVSALRSVGYKKEDAVERARRAAEHFRGLGKTPTEEELFKQALRRQVLAAAKAS